MVKSEPIRLRAFKTAWFSKHAIKAGIDDHKLCQAIDEMNAGQWDADLGGNVFKKRLNDNRHRSIVLSKTDAYWFFTFLFAKADQENISKDELKGFKKLAKDYSLYSDKDIKIGLENKDLMEICDDCTKKV
jgi:hypothetical protein